MRNRVNIGKDFNSAPNDHAQDGAEIDVVPSCEVFANYFNGNTSGLGGQARESLGATGTSKVAYRYTTLDGKYMVIRDNAHGWGFMKRDCVTNWNAMNGKFVPGSPNEAADI